MLKIYSVCLEMVAEVHGLGIADRDLARQMRRSSMSVALHVAEGAAVRDGRRRVRYGDALGSAMETRAAAEVAVAVGYLDAMPTVLRQQLGLIIGTLRKLV